MKKLTTLKFFFFCCIALLLGSELRAQEVRQVNGRLVFPSVAAFQSVYDRLDAEVQRLEETGSDGSEIDDLYPSLAAFEKSMGFVSLRQADLQAEAQQLSKGTAPENLQLSWMSTDPVYSALVNKDYVVQVADTIYIFNSERFAIKIPSNNDRVLNMILSGTDPKTLGKDVIVTDRGPSFGPGEGDCESFTANFPIPWQLITSNTGQFTFSGTVSGTNVKYKWTFGDNTTSDLKNPVKTFANQGVFNVCVEVSNDEGCYSSKCKLVAVNQSCSADFNYNQVPGTPGLISFEDNSKSTSSIVSYKWEVNGEEFNTKNITYKFGCDGSYDVSLTIETATGCKRTTTQTVTVSSYNCCDSDLDENETKYTYKYDNDKRRIITHANTWNPWIGSKNVNAEMTNYRKTGIGIWVKEKTKMKVEIIGNMYKKGESGCQCVLPFDVSCNDSGLSVKHLKAKKVVSKDSKTNKKDLWQAKFYHNDKLIHGYFVPYDCE